jgi:hypothetical protein
VRQCSELNCQRLRFFIGVSRDEVAAKDNLALSRLLTATRTTLRSIPDIPLDNASTWGRAGFQHIL